MVTSMKTARRFDTIRLDGIKETSQGFLRIPVFACRTGIQVYHQKDGTKIREFRPPEEVFHEDTLASLRSCPVTNDHPDEFVNQDNVNGLMKGMTADHVSRVKKDSVEYAKTEVIITDKAMIQDIRSGKKEVSCGYQVALDMTPGFYQGQKYDCIQRKITHNHLAIVDRGRAGPECRLRLDSDAELVDSIQGGTMKIKIGNQEFDVADDVAEAFKTHESEQKNALDAAQKADNSDALAEANKAKDQLQAKVDTLETENKKLKEDKTDVQPADISSAVSARLKLVRIADRMLSKEDKEKIDEMTDKDIRVAVIKTQDKEFKSDGKSDDYIEARFDTVVELTGKSDAVHKKAGEALTPKGDKPKEKKDSFKTEEELRAEAMDRDSQAWQKPVGRQAEGLNQKTAQ